MMRILVFLVILPLLCCAVLGAGAEEVPCAYAVTTKNNVNIRADSTVSSQSLAIIPQGDTVGVIRAEMSGTECGTGLCTAACTAISGGTC